MLYAFSKRQENKKKIDKKRFIFNYFYHRNLSKISEKRKFFKGFKFYLLKVPHLNTLTKYVRRLIYLEDLCLIMPRY